MIPKLSFLSLAIFCATLPGSLRAEPVLIPHTDSPAPAPPPDAASLSLHSKPGEPPAAPTTVQLWFTDSDIHAQFTCTEPSPEKMRRTVKEHDREVWTDDSVELFLAPDPTEPFHYYHLVVNSLGTTRDEYWDGSKSDLSWESHAATSIRMGNGQWTVDAALPLTSLDRVPILGDTWLGNFARERYASPENSTWQPYEVVFHEPQRFAALGLPGVSSIPSIRQVSANLIYARASAALRETHSLTGLLGRPARSEPSRTMQNELAGWQRQLSSTQDPEALWSSVKQFEAAAPSLHSRIPWARLAERSHQPYGVCFLSPLQKLMPKDLPPARSQVQGELFAARGEAQSLQVIIASTAGPLHRVTVTADLIGPGGSHILPELHRVGYVNVRHPTPGGTGVPGRYPDPLFPLAPFDVTAGETQSVWLTAWVPRDAPPGKYHGQVTVAPQGSPGTRLKLVLTVFHATLPAQSALKTDVGIWGTAREVYAKKWNQQRADRFTEQGLRYRFTSPPPLPWDKVWSHGSDGAVTADWSAFDPAVESWMAKGSTAFSIDSILDWSLDPPAPAAQPEASARFRLLGQHLRDRGWEDRFYFYRFDEPGADASPRIQKLCDFIHAAAPNIKILLTGFHPGFQQFAGRIGIWVPHINQFDPAFMDARRAAGDDIWMYVCIATVNTTYPDVWRIDWTGTAHRAIGHWLWRYQCSGFLYWCVDYWTQGVHKSFDLLDEPMAFPGGNGDGFLFYPDPAGGDPLPSIRVELMRDGFQDYDLLHLLQDKATQLQSNPATARKQAPWLHRATAILQTTTLVPTPSDFSKDPAAYDRFHREVLEALEQ